MHATIKRWGNSYAIRLTKKDLARLDLKEGDEVDVQFLSSRRPVDVSDLGFLTDPDGEPAVSQDHDRYLYGWDRTP